MISHKIIRKSFEWDILQANAYWMLRVRFPIGSPKPSEFCHVESGVCGALYDPYPVFWKLLELHLLLHPPTPPRDTLNHNWCDFERLISHHSFVFLDYIGIVFLSGFENFLSRCVRRENFSSAVLLVKISSTAHTGRQPSWKKDMLFSVKWWDDSCDYGIPRIRILSQSCS